MSVHIQISYIFRGGVGVLLNNRLLIPAFAAGIRLLVSENEQLINQRSMEGHWNTEYFKLTFLILNLNRKPLYNEGWEKFK